MSTACREVSEADRTNIAFPVLIQPDVTGVAFAGVVLDPIGSRASMVDMAGRVDYRTDGVVAPQVINWSGYGCIQTRRRCSSSPTPRSRSRTGDAGLGAQALRVEATECDNSDKASFFLFNRAIRMTKPPQPNGANN